MNPSGAPDPDRGSRVRRRERPIPHGPRGTPCDQRGRNATTFRVLELTIRKASSSWWFIRTREAPPATDSGFSHLLPRTLRATNSGAPRAVGARNQGGDMHVVVAMLQGKSWT